MGGELGFPASLDEYVIPIQTTDPAQKLSDLQPLRPIFNDREVIGLGEATHGTREFFQLKHRIIRYLVRECTLRLVGFEANFSESMALNAFVVRGEGDPRDALSGVYFWTWNTEAVITLLEWLRAFNADRPLADRVRFYGFDAQYTAGPVVALHSFLERADPKYHTTIQSTLDTIDDDGRPASQDDDVETRLQAADRLVDDLQTRLREHEPEYVAATDRETWALACRHLRILAQACDRKAAMNEDDLDRAMAIRDEAMANNIAWIRDYEDADQIALWAHNDHVNRVETRAKGDAAPSMGAHLADRCGEDYYALGFEFGGGSFQALTKPNTEDGEKTGHTLGEQTLATALPNTVGRVLADRDYPSFILDFEATRDDQRISTWVDATQRLHSIGALYRRDDPASHVEPYTLSEAFDGLCYIDDTTRARPIE